ncbi:hypothetical protein ASG72_13110 [Bosea sp. Leaf344]|uniref:hypothetical protein n=1 Tax=Bosea sp. Leaf344 TaxID=1736346 RepID=UPI0006F427F8|nr:hypothetical protein [Bosea sp. Leaf344]KQU50783.1 hypothetical protein ASG72_13110 [Bosea sp. Leaf344]
MFGSVSRTVLTVLALSLSSAAVPAQEALKDPVPQNQSPPPGGPQPTAGGANASGLGPKTTDPSQIDKGQNMILPSAGSSGESRAPTMVFDCNKNPQDCTKPLNSGDKASAPEVSAPPATSKP